MTTYYVHFNTSKTLPNLLKLIASLATPSNPVMIVEELASYLEVRMTQEQASYLATCGYRIVE